MKKTCITAICFIFLAGTATSVFGQAKTTPSKVVPKESPQKLLADSLYNLAKKYDQTGDFKQAMVFFEKSKAIYQSINETQKVGSCLTNIGITYYYQGEYLKALSYYNQSIKAYEITSYKKGIVGSLNNIGGTHYTLGNFPKALGFYKRALTIQEEIGDRELVATLKNNIGGIYSVVGDYAVAKKYYAEVYAIRQQLRDERGIARVLNSMGFDYTKQGNYEKAFENLSRALKIIEREKDKQGQIEILSSLGELFYKQSDFEKALSYFNLGLKYATEGNNLHYIGDFQISIGNTFNQLGKAKAATEKCNAGLKIAKKLGEIPMQKDACKCLYKSYKALGNKSSALDYHEEISVLEDSLQLKETSNKMMNMEFQKQQLADSVVFIKKEAIVEQKHQEEIRQKEKQRNIIIASLGVMLLVAGGLWSSLRLVRKSRAALSLEKDRSEALLLNILPPDVAEELKAKGSVTAKDFELVSILFTDFKSFTQTAETMSPQSLVEEINIYFQAFDLISEKYQIEKIKTIGDAYMAAGGMAKADANALKNTVLAGLEMQSFVKQRAIENQQAQKPAFEMRLGIHAGPIVAGIVGVKKFQYDIWGDTVNTASRMESNGAVGKVNISETLYQILKDDVSFTFEARGSIEAKGKGEMSMYFVEMTV